MALKVGAVGQGTCGQRELTRRELDNGFVEITARLDPEEAEALWAALERMVKDRSHARGGRPDRQPPASAPRGSAPAVRAHAMAAHTPAPEWDGSLGEYNWVARAEASDDRSREHEFTFTSWASP